MGNPVMKMPIKDAPRDGTRIFVLHPVYGLTQLTGIRWTFYHTEGGGSYDWLRDDGTHFPYPQFWISEPL